LAAEGVCGDGRQERRGEQRGVAEGEEELVGCRWGREDSGEVVDLLVESVEVKGEPVSESIDGRR